MKKILSLILCAVAATALQAQSVVSDALFGKGVELYKQGKYKQAIGYFEQSQQDDDANEHMIEAIKTYNLAWIAHCHYQLGEIEQAEELMGRDYHLDPVDRRLTRYSDSLTVEAQEAAEYGNLNGAIKLMNEVIKHETSALGTQSEFVANSLVYNASFMFGNGDAENAIKTINRGLAIYKSDPKLRTSYTYGCALLQKASFMMMLEQWEDAKTLATEGLIIIENWKLALSGDQADAYYILASCESANVLTENAQVYTTKLTESLSSIPEESALSYLQHVQFCSNALKYYGQGEESLQLIDRYIAIVQAIPEMNAAYLNLLYWKSAVEQSIHQHDEARVNIITSIRGLEQDPMFDPNYLDEYYSLYGSILYTLGQFDEAITANNEAIRRSKNIGQDRIQIRIAATQNLAYCYCAQSNEKLSMNTINDLMKIVGSNYGYNNRLYADALYLKGYIEGAFERLDDLEISYRKAAEVYNNVGCKQEAVSTLFELTEAYASLEKYQRKAIETGIKALEINQQNQTTDRDYLSVEIMYLLGNIYKGIGNKAKSKQYYSEAIDLCKKANISNNLTHSKVLLAEAQLLAAEGSYEQSIALMHQSLSILEQIEGKNSMLYNETAVYLASLYEQSGNREIAIRNLKDIDVVSPKGEALINATGLMTLLNIYGAMGEPDRIISVYGKLKPFIEKNTLTPELASMFEMSLVGAYALKGEWDKCAQSINRPTEATEKVLRSNFLTMSSEERMSYWSNISNYYSVNLPSFCIMAPENTVFPTVAYNGALTSKGMLLQTESSISTIIEKKGSADLKSKYQLLASKKGTYGQLNNKPANGLDEIQGKLRQQKLDSLRIEIDLLEHELTEQVSAELGDFTSFLDIKWTDVKKRLKNNELAVEFVRYMIDGTIGYAALTIDKNSQYAKFIKIADQQSLADASNESSRTLAEMIWKPILGTFGQYKTVYFSPDGLLYGMPIESLEDWATDQLLSDRIDFYRLSSTREIVLNKDYKKHEAAVYGGMVYDLSANELIAESANFKGPKVRSVNYSPLLRENRESESSLEELPGTKVEAETVYELLHNKIAATTIYEGKQATELSLKALSGTDLGILHIGTHGFYETMVNNAANGTTNFVVSPKEQEDIALSYTGLFFSGAQNYLDGIEMPEDIDDGVLTALEISMLDFHELDLVTLSACQTGQGDVSSDGVFGLQRGFKKSGANSILMSLWNVDDEATQVLMSEFYKYLMDGTNKHTALEMAKQKVRSFEKWKDGKYWAAFILLDAIN